MSNLVPFVFEGKYPVRATVVDGHTMFCARDVALALGYENPSKAYQDHCKWLKKLSYNELLDLNWRKPNPQGEYVMPEGDVYRLVAKSQLESAQRFESWVYDKVIPTVRKRDSYSLPKTQPEPAVHALPQQKATAILKTTVEAYTFLGAPLHIAQNEAVKYAHKETGVDYSPALAYSPAQDNIKEEEVMLEPMELGRTFDVSAQYINKVLARNGYQLKGGASWIPTALGEKFCSKHAWRKGTKSGYNLKWKSSLLDRLLQVVDPEEVA